MKKVLALMSVALLASFASLSAQALNATGTFNVTVNLTSACTVDTAATSAAAVFNYTSLQAAPATFTTSFNVQCTNTLPIVSVALDGTGTYTDAATNLAYTLTLAGVPVTATGAAQAVTVTGNMGAAQAGTCATPTCNNAASANKTRTVTITY